MKGATAGSLTISLVLLISGGCDRGDAAQQVDDSAQPSQPAPAIDTAAQHPPQHVNRLADQSSLYLRMHAHNPVDWYPWGPEALAKAQQEKKLIFLSVGYSSCHWCHVMERESFMDPEIAERLNKHFVAIKVDREQRPDIDSIYMTALQIFNLATGGGRSGGWPMSIFLTPDGRPFFCATYLPARDGDRGARTGFLTVLRKVHEIWQDSPDKIQQDAATLTRLVKNELEAEPATEGPAIDAQLIQDVQESLARQFDSTYGGFGYSPSNPHQPKFPEPSNLYFLLERMKHYGSEDAAAMLHKTLDQMARGGIRDHLGGGFHRYSVDRQWSIPHFEKMLYDNAQLATVYAEAYKLTQREQYRRVTEEILAFVFREMTDQRGGFYTALDAESEGEEGKYYRWTKTEVEQLLSKEEHAIFSAAYGLNEPPNFEERFYVLELQSPLEELAGQQQITEAQMHHRLQQARQKLLQARSQRGRPLTDDKILTAWNGLMIRGFADAGRLLEEDRYIEAAERAAVFLLENLKTADGRLLRSYSQGQAELNAYLDDYAFLVDGLLALYRANEHVRWLDEAEQLTEKQLELFWDERGGGFFFTSDDHESLLARAKEHVDGALPAGNSVAAENLLFLAEQLDKPAYRDRARQTVEASLRAVQGAPAASPRLMVSAVKLIEQ